MPLIFLRTQIWKHLNQKDVHLEEPQIVISFKFNRPNFNIFHFKREKLMYFLKIIREHLSLKLRRVYSYDQLNEHVVASLVAIFFKILRSFCKIV